MQYGKIYNSPIGKMGLVADENALLFILFDSSHIPADVILQDTPILLKTASQLDEYFAGTRTCFDLPLAPHGSEFEKNVWLALCNIPYGETRSYKDIATAVGSPKACRAVGRANSRNPLPIVIPCHRVIGANNKLVGFTGGLSIKEHLLQLEGFIL